MKLADYGHRAPRRENLRNMAEESMMMTNRSRNVPDINVDPDFLLTQQECEWCSATVVLPGYAAIKNLGSGEHIACPNCGTRYYAAGDDGRFTRPDDE